MARGNVAGILVVEDEPDLAALMADLLRVEGYRAVLARNGREALALVASERPALVVLDLALPDVDGREVLRLLKNQRATADIPIIVVSAYVGRLSAEDYRLLGAVLEKPFDLDELLSAIELALVESAERNEPKAGRPTPLKPS